MKMAKQRIDSEGEGCAAIAVLYHAIFESLLLLTPFTPFITESIYQSFYRKREGKKSISLFDWPSQDKKRRDQLLEKRFEICRQAGAAIASARQKASLPLRWPVEEVRIVSESTEVLSAAEHLPSLIESLGNVRKVSVAKQPKSEFTVSINRSKVGAAFKKDSPLALAALEKESPEAIAAWLSGEEKEYLSDGKWAITREMVAVEEKA